MMTTSLAVFTAQAIPSVPVITTVAGSGKCGYRGDDQSATFADLNGPWAITVDNAGNLYIADACNHRVRRVGTDGVITTVAGTGHSGYNGDHQSATSADLSWPWGITVDNAGNLYIADTHNQRVRRVGTDGMITTVAGTGHGGCRDDHDSATTSDLNGPSGVAVDSAGNLYIADTENHRVRRVGTDGMITTVAGTGHLGYNGDDQLATSAELNHPMRMVVDSAGNLYIADAGNHRVRRVGTDKMITTVAGTGDRGYNGDHQPATSAVLSAPSAVALDGSGNLYIAEVGNQRVRKVVQIPVDEMITTVAGTGHPYHNGDHQPASSADLAMPCGVAVDSSGNLYIADSWNRRIRRVGTDGVITTVAGTGYGGYNGDDQSATSAELRGACGVAVDSAGNLHIADLWNNRVRRVGTDGMITTVAGTGHLGYNGDDQPASSASLTMPCGVAADSVGNLYIADTYCNRIRRVATDGMITTVAGTGHGGYNGDHRPATSADLAAPCGVAVDDAGNLYIADASNDRVRRVGTDGMITTVAGTGHGGYNGDHRPAISAELGAPSGVALDDAGNLYIADTENNRVRRVGTDGMITTVAGTGHGGYNGDHRPATSAELNGPHGVAVDSAGNLYVVDTLNNRVRQITKVSVDE
jgi:sugar lactone lactonase YvrE